MGDAKDPRPLLDESTSLARVLGLTAPSDGAPEERAADLSVSASDVATSDPVAPVAQVAGATAPSDGIAVYAGPGVSAGTALYGDSLVVGSPTMGNPELTEVTPASSAAVGRVVIANRAAILLQASSIERMLSDTIDRAKETRSNSESVPELEAIREEVHELREMLLAAVPPAEPVGSKALQIKARLLDWGTKDHVLDTALFGFLLVLIAQFGLLPSAIAITLLRGKEFGEVLKHLVKLMKRDEADE